MKKLKFNDYIASSMKRNVEAGYNYCIENNCTGCKVNTMKMGFIFSENKVQIHSQGHVYNYQFEVKSAGTSTKKLEKMLGGKLYERVICRNCKKGFDIPFLVTTTDEHYCKDCEGSRE